MGIDNEAWLTVYDPEFCDDRYLYHFTDINTVIKILYNNQLKFSKISNANDPIESKPKINITDDKKYDSNNIIEHFSKVNKSLLQILCFTKDMHRVEEQVSERVLYTDYSGRGFSFPRMWAQYANNNLGVCLVFNKEVLIKLIQKYTLGTLIYHGDIEYKTQFETYKFDSNSIKSLIDTISRYSELERNFFDLHFFNTNIDFVKYNYFSKLDDWKGENEYRFLAFGDRDYLIGDIFDALTGVIIGEYIEEHDREIIKMLCDDNCEIKKISFTCNGCKLTNIN